MHKQYEISLNNIKILDYTKYLNMINITNI